MDAFNFDNIQSEKSTAMRQFRRLRSLTKLFRLVELFAGLALISWLSSHLPFAVRISGEYFKLLLSVVVSPTFVFVFGNAIVLTLFVKSCKNSGTSSNNNIPESEFYESLRSDASDAVLEPKNEEEDVVFQDKEMIECEEKNPPPQPIPVDFEDVFVPALKSCTTFEEKLEIEEEFDVSKVYRRTQSENLKWKCSEEEEEEEEEEEVVVNKNQKQILRRSETDICSRKYGQQGKQSAEGKKDLSDDGEEFRKTIEAFIAKQVKFHREESLAIVLHSQA